MDHLLDLIPIFDQATKILFTCWLLYSLRSYAHHKANVVTALTLDDLGKALRHICVGRVVAQENHRVSLFKYGEQNIGRQVVRDSNKRSAQK